MRVNLGFMLIELMIVVTIIGILASIAIPSYQKYVLKTRFTEILTITNFFKNAVILALQEGYPLDQINNETIDIPTLPSSKNIASIVVAKGIITTTATALLNNVTYILKPNQDGSHWTIHGTCLKLGLCKPT